MQITTTINPAIQDYSQSVLSQGVNTIAGSTSVNNGAILVSDPGSGAILAMVGSPDFNNEEISGQINNVISWNQPGSAIKPILYTAALEGRDATNYYTPATILWDVPVQYGVAPNAYSPVNFDGRFRGPVALRAALQNSYNVPAVKTLEWLGIERFTTTARNMGLRFQDSAVFGLPTALGATEVRLYDMVAAYGTLATQGQRVPLYTVVSIRDADGNNIEVPGRAESNPAVAPPIAYLMQNIMSDNDARSPAFGTNSGLAFPAYPGRVAAKTGTTDGNRDLWTVGFSSNFVVGVWLGRVDDGVTNNTTQTSAVPIWNAVMGAVLSSAPPAPFNPPTGVIQQNICPATGALYDATCRTNPVTEVFTQSQPPPSAGQAFVQEVAVDTWTQLRANQYCADNVVTERYLAIADASAAAWLANTTEGRAYAQANNLPTRTAPTGECVINQTPPQIVINAPTEGQVVTETVAINATVLAGDLNRYQVEIAPQGSTTYTVIAGPFNQQSQNGVIANWDSRTVQNGTYTLRLAAFSNQGGFVYRTRQIVVNNIPPTPTITPSPTITPLPPLPTFAPFTPLPFPTDTFGAQSGVVPTNTNIPLGGLSNTGQTPTSTPQFN
jgi:membrane carboxypeptidase/penicillin-binding protein PbpC